MSLLFDEVGLPIGDDADRFWRSTVSRLFSELETDGWDQPHTLWAVLTPQESELRDPEVIEFLRTLADEDEIATAYTIVGLGVDDNARRLMAGVVPPMGAAAIMLVTESWTSNRLTDDAGPTAREVVEAMMQARLTGRDSDIPENLDEEFQNYLRGDRKTWVGERPDRVETRNALIMQADGTLRMLNHFRGSDLNNLDTLTNALEGPDSMLKGVMVDLLRRIWGLPVQPMVPVGEVLGITLMSAAEQIMRQQAILTGITVPQALVEASAVMLDSLDTSFVPDPNEQDMMKVFSARGGPLASQAHVMLRFGSLGPLLMEGRRTAKAGWEGFFTRPGAQRWLIRDENGAWLTPELRDWYGIGHLSRFIEERLPRWGEAYTKLSTHCSDTDQVFLDKFLSDMGWTYSPTAHL